MKRRSFIKGAATVAAATAINPLSAQDISIGKRDLYELREYKFTGGGGARQLKSYVADAVIPLANDYNVRVGAFGEYSLDDCCHQSSVDSGSTDIFAHSSRLLAKWV